MEVLVFQVASYSTWSNVKPDSNYLSHEGRDLCLIIGHLESIYLLILHYVRQHVFKWFKFYHVELKSS